MTIELSSSDIVPSVCLSANIDQYAVSTEPTGCVLSNDSVIGDGDNMLVQQSTYNIENSNDVVIGPVTHFHCPVTIIHKSQGQGQDQGQDNDKPPKIRDADAGIAHSCSHSHEKCAPNKLSTNQAPRESRSLHLKYLELLKQYKTRRKLLHVILIITTLIAFAFAAAITVVFTQNTPEEMLFDNVTKNIEHEGHEGHEGHEDYENEHEHGEPQVIPRSFWGARPPLSVRKLETPVKYIIVAHTAGAACQNVSTCSPILQSLQSFAVVNNSPDIGYNFLIGGDGNIYVGRGWDAINYLQNHCISVSFMGNYIYDDFTPKMQQALKDIIRIGVMQEKVVKDYTLLSHSQTWATMSPGPKIRAVIEKWPQYYKQEYIELPN